MIFFSLLKGKAIEYVQAKYTFIARKRDQLGFKPGDIIAVKENRRHKHWWTGIFFLNKMFDNTYFQK